MEKWREEHNWALLILIAVGGLMTAIVLTVWTTHLEDVEHIKLGHCQVQGIGTDVKHWEICK